VDEMAEAVMRQMDRRTESMRVDRRGWTPAQWVEDARRLMDEPDGAVTSLVNGHVTHLLGELARVERNVTALLAHCDQIDAAGHSPIVATFGTAAIRGFLEGREPHPYDDL